jgi:beta-mannosidase
MTAESFRVNNPELLNHFTEYVPERVPRMLARASAITDISSASLEDMAEATQIASAEFYQIMIQSFRENYPVTGGIMLWVLKRAWTTVGIQLVDGLSEPIVPFYYVKNAYAPVNVQVSLPHLIWGVREEIPLPLNLINESGEDISDVTVGLEVYDHALNKVMEKNYEKNISQGTFLTVIDRAVFLVPEDFRDHFFFVRSALYRKGRLLNQSLYWPKCLSLMDDGAFRTGYRSAPRENIVFRKGPWLKEEVQKAEKAVLHAVCRKIASGAGRHCFSIYLSNNSPHAAFPVSLGITDHGCVHYVSDNFFFMAPGETRELRLEILDRTGNLNRFHLNISAWNTEPIKITLESGGNII